MEIINVTDEIIEINVTEAVVNVVTQNGAYPLPSNVFSVFGRVGNVVGQAGDYTTSIVGEGTNLYYTDARSRAAISENITGLEYSSASGIFSLANGYLIPTQAMLDAKQDDLNGTGIVKSTAGTISYLTDNTANWDAAYNDKINSASVSGTTTKTLTLNQQDGGTITASWTDDNTDAVTSVFGRTGAVIAANGDYTTSQVTEGSNLYFTNARVHSAISGTAPISEVSGVISIAQSNTTTDGYLSSTDWNTFNNKQSLITAGTTDQYYRGDKTFQILNTSAVAEGTNLYYTDTRSRSAISENITGIDYSNATGVFSLASGYIIPTQAMLDAKQDDLNGTGIVKSTGGTISYLTDNTANWDAAYNDKINSAAVTGTSTKTLTLNQQDGGTITASWTDIDTGLTSVGLSMPAAFSVSGSPLTSNGVISVTGAGLASQYMRGDGTLADFPTQTGGGSSVSYYLNSSVSQGTLGGVAYRQLSKNPVAGAGTDITATTNGYIASYITDANDPSLLEVPGGNFNCEFYFSVNSNNHDPFIYAELYKYDGTTFTLLGSSQAVPEYLTSGTNLNPYYFAIPVATASLTLTDRIAIRIYVNVDTREVTLHTEDNHLCQVVTTFSKGMTSLNNLTKQVQYLTTGTNGTNFAIVSSNDTHTFNLPTASATNTGKLSSSDWGNFNTAYNDTIVSASVSGTTTKTLTLTQQDAGTITASWTDLNTDAVSSVFGRTGAVVAANGDYTTTQVTEGTNLYYTEARVNANTNVAANTAARHAAVTIGTANGLSLSTQALSLAAANTTTTGALTSTDWNTFNGKQAALNGTGFVKISGTTISYDNSTYLTTSAASSTYLPLAGGTLTGALGGTSATFSGDLSIVTSTSAILNIQGNSGNSKNIFFKSTGAADNSIRLYQDGGTNNFIIATGDGTTAPTNRLTIASTGVALFSSRVRVNGATDDADIAMQVKAPSGAGKFIMFGRDASDIAVYTLSSAGAATFSSSVTINGGGNPDLDVKGTAIIRGNGSAYTTHYFTTGAANVAQYYQYNASGTLINLFNAGGNSYITGGNVGIGTSSPSAALNVVTTAAVTAIFTRDLATDATLRILGDSDGSIIDTQGIHNLRFFTNDTERMRITSGGVLLVNQSSISAASAGVKMQVNSDILSTGSLAGFFWESRSGGVTSNSNWYGWYATGGAVYLYNGSSNIAVIGGGSGLYTAISDINKKKDFEDSTIGLNAIMGLKPTLFRMKEEDESVEKTLGFIAQQVKEFIPQAYVEGEDFIGLSDRPIIAALVKAIQELKAEIDELKNK
jgi:hypothetical protein